MPDVDFEVGTKSIYYSKLSGSTTSDLLGLTVAVDGKVDEGILSLTVTTTAFEGDPATDAAELYSTYKGTMDINVAGLDPISSEQRVYVMKPKADAASKIKLQIKNFAFQDMALGTISIDTVAVTKRGDVYAFKAEGRQLKLTIAGTATDVVLDLSGTILNGVMDLSLDINVMQSLSVKVGFEGNAVVESTTATLYRYEFDNGAAITDTVRKSRSFYIYYWSDTEAAKLNITPRPILDATSTMGKVTARYEGTDHEIEANQPVDFSKFADGDYIRYVVHAEDPSYTATYTLYAKILEAPVSQFDFTTGSWIPNGEEPPMDFDTPAGWATSNGAATMLKVMEDQDNPGNYLYPQSLPFPVSKAADNAARIITVDTKGTDMFLAIVPAITAGTLFQGTFKISISSTLKSTQFGVPYNKKPKTFKGEYKYAPGATYYKTVVTGTTPGSRVVSKEEVPGTTDQCAINAILYEVENYEETLDGTNILTASNIVATAILPDGSAKAEYTPFSIDFTFLPGKSFDASRKYKLALVCSSSANGAAFEGAPGSELIIKSLEVVNE